MFATRPVGLSVLLIAPALALCPPVAGAQVETTFDSDLDGWIIEGDNTHFWNPTGGHPDGCLEVPDNASGPWSVAGAPGKFLGDWEAATPGDSLSYDVLFLPTAPAVGNPPAVFRISGPLGAARFNTTIPDSEWVHVSAPLDSTAWTIESGTWTGLLRAVTALDVAVEYRSGDETVRVDNILLDVTPTAIDLYQPCETSDFEVNAAGWTGDGTATPSRPAAGGDIGAYLRVSSPTGLGRVLFPLTYFGDWSGLDGAGTIGFSFAYFSGTIAAGRELRLELSGPGGSAHVGKPSDDFLDYAHVWYRLEWPLEESAWTVDSGTWAGLLGDVTGVAISADLATASDTYGIDNVFRNGPGCPTVPVAPITIHEAGYSLCDSYPFRDGSALALNPADGELYGLVSAAATVTSGGGVYRLTGGAGRGVRMHPYTSPKGLVFTADGDGFVSEDGSGDLYRFVGTDSSMIWVDGGVGFHSGDDDIAGLAVAPAGFLGANVSPGDLIVTDWGNGGPNEIWSVNPDTAGGGRLLVPDPGSADFWDVVPAAAGQVYVADTIHDNSLWRLGSDGSLTAFPLSTTIVNMKALAYDEAGNAIYTQRTSAPFGLFRIDLADGQVTLIADGFHAAGTGNLEIDSANRTLYVTDPGDNQLYTICLPAAVAVEGDPGARPRPVLALSPNPSFGPALISFRLPEAASVRVDVIDPSGRRVRSVMHGELSAGNHALSWDGRDDAGRKLASGVYFLRVAGGGFDRTARAVILR